jgi:hypothetical protein
VWLLQEIREQLYVLAHHALVMSKSFTQIGVYTFESNYLYGLFSGRRINPNLHRRSLSPADSYTRAAVMNVATEVARLRTNTAVHIHSNGKLHSV